VPINLNNAVDGTVNRPAIIRFAVKKDPPSETNQEAVIFKSTYFTNQIEILPQSGATLGQCRCLIDKIDSQDIDAGAYRWDLEVTRQDFVRTQSGQVSVVAGSKVVTGTSTSFLSAKVGDVLHLISLSNPLPVKISKIISNTQLEIEAALFQTQNNVTFEIRRGKHKTPTRGPFTIVQSVVSE
jgi:hypothetical protein